MREIFLRARRRPLLSPRQLPLLRQRERFPLLSAGRPLAHTLPPRRMVVAGRRPGLCRGALGRTPLWGGAPVALGIPEPTRHRRRLRRNLTLLKLAHLATSPPPAWHRQLRPLQTKGQVARVGTTRQPLLHQSLIMRLLLSPRHACPPLNLCGSSSFAPRGAGCSAKCLSTSSGPLRSLYTCPSPRWRPRMLLSLSRLCDPRHYQRPLGLAPTPPVGPLAPLYSKVDLKLRWAS